MEAPKRKDAPAGSPSALRVTRSPSGSEASTLTLRRSPTATRREPSQRRTGGRPGPLEGAGGLARPQPSSAEESA